MKKVLAFFLVFFMAVQVHAVRVLLAEKISKASILVSGPILINDNGKKYIINKGGTFEVLALTQERIKVGSLEAKTAITVTPLDGSVFTYNKNKYSSPLTFYPGKNMFEIVENLDMEEYLYGVLPYEMSHTWPAEALKAQAVAARTYAYKNVENPLSKNYDISASHITSQVYKGAATIYPSVKEAVDATKNKVLKYEGKTFQTYFHANCGGHGTDPEVWGSVASQIKPLNGAKCSYCSTGKGHSWKYTMPKKEISAYAGGSIKSISIAAKAAHGHATYLNFKTDKGTKKIRCNDVRLGLGPGKLRSCYFTKIEPKGDSFYFEGLGFGHGVGLCQEGAKGMAESGKKFTEILSNYYPGATLTDI